LEIDLILHRYARNAWQVSEIGQGRPDLRKNVGERADERGCFKDPQISQKGQNRATTLPPGFQSAILTKRILIFGAVTGPY
jgi:hypothetical protein